MENEQQFLQSLKKQRKEFEGVKNFVETQFAENGLTEETDFESAIVLFMLQKLKQTAAAHIVACDVNLDEEDEEILPCDIAVEKAQWEKLSKTLSCMDKVEAALKAEMQSKYNYLDSNGA